MSFLENSKMTVYDFYQPLTGLRKTSGDVGLEIELEGADHNQTAVACKGWNPHADNSLRGPRGQGQGGVEYTTNGAVKFGAVYLLVENLRSMITASGFIPREDSPRTSTHVHVNVQSMSLIDVFGYITLFAAIEPMFLHLCGPRRDGNSFCSPSYDTGDLPEWFQDVFRSIEQYPSNGDLPQRGKYASLGTFRLHDLGTLECRCFPYSLDPNEVQMWCSWLLNIKKIVEAQEDKSMRGLIKLGLHDPMVLARDIFGETNVSLALTSELIQFGSREAYELTRLLKFYLNKKPDEKKKKGLKDGLTFHTDINWAHTVGTTPMPPIMRRAR